MALDGFFCASMLQCCVSLSWFLFKPKLYSLIHWTLSYPHLTEVMLKDPANR